MSTRRQQVGSYLLLTMFTAIVLLPVGWLVLTAVSPSSGGVDLSGFAPRNFAAAWTQAGFSHYLRASVVIATAAVVATTFLSVLSGFAFGVLHVVGERLLFPLVLAGIMIPLEAIIVPLYFNFRSVQLTDSYLGLILAHTGLSVSFGTFWMRSTFRALPAGLVEAAEIDGASTRSVLWRILVPVSRPAVLTLALLVFTWTWNDYFLALVLAGGSGAEPATLALGTFQGRYASQVNLLSAAAVLISVPVVVLYLFFQRQFISGILSGALKD